jgi:hypothetical protein
VASSTKIPSSAVQFMSLSVNMRAFFFSWLPLNFWATLISSTPTRSDSLYLSAQKNSTNQLNVLPYPPSTSNGTLPNVTVSHKGGGEKYRIPNSSITLYFHLGFACNETAMHDSINAAREYCSQQIATGAKGVLPRSEDPFDENLGYGIAIIIVSARPDHRLTWSVLDDILRGMWIFLVVEGRYIEAMFDIVDARWDLVGRGLVEPVEPTPWVATSQQ